MPATYFKTQPPWLCPCDFFFPLCYMQELYWLQQTSVRFGMDTEDPRAVEGSDTTAEH